MTQWAGMVGWSCVHVPCASLVSHKFLLVVSLWDKCCYKHYYQGGRFFLICGEVVVTCLLSREKSSGRFGFKQPLVGEKRCVTTLITAAEETRQYLDITILFLCFHLSFNLDCEDL